MPALNLSVRYLPKASRMPKLQIKKADGSISATCNSSSKNELHGRTPTEVSKLDQRSKLFHVLEVWREIGKLFARRDVLVVAIKKKNSQLGSFSPEIFFSLPEMA